MPALLPCPCCGGVEGEKRFEVELTHFDTELLGLIPRIRCTNPLCGLQMDGFNFENGEPVANLARAWNRREGLK